LIFKFETEFVNGLKSNKRLWLFIAVYVIFIYLTLPIMRPVLNFLYEALGKEALSIGVNGLLALAIVSFSIYVYKSGFRMYPRLALIFLIMLAGGVVAMGLDIPEERVHFLEYGVLGLLVLKATGVGSIRFVLYSVILVSLIGAVEELIQWSLPNRVGDMRDVLMNVFGGSLGIGVGWLWYERV
jgi:hypothetical protein